MTPAAPGINQELVGNDRLVAVFRVGHADLAALDAKIEEMVLPFEEAIARLDEIPGIGRADSRPRAPGVLGTVRTQGQGICREEEGQRHHRSRQPLLGSHPGCGCDRRGPHQHLPPLWSWADSVMSSAALRARRFISSTVRMTGWSGAAVLTSWARVRAFSQFGADLDPVLIFSENTRVQCAAASASSWLTVPGWRWSSGRNRSGSASRLSPARPGRSRALRPFLARSAGGRDGHGKFVAQCGHEDEPGGVVLGGGFPGAGAAGAAGGHVALRGRGGARIGRSRNSHN